LFADWFQHLGFDIKILKERKDKKKKTTRFRHGRLYTIYNREDETNRYFRLGQKEQV
jgi:hypothetical protein